jgi:hypothetical protein
VTATAALAVGVHTGAAGVQHVVTGSQYDACR